MLKASRKSRRVLMAGAVGIASLTVAGLGLTASGAAAAKIRTVAETQVVAMAQAVAPTPPVPETPAVPATERKRKIVINRDGKTETYEGAQADAYIAAHPEMVRHGDGRQVNRHRIVIRGKDGKTSVYEGPEAKAYLKAHPEMRPPVPPVPPVPGAMAWPAPPAPGAPSVMVTTDADGKTVTRTVIHSGPGAYAYANGKALEVVHAKCRGGNDREFVRSETKNGKARMVICEDRVERFAADQARMGERMQRMALTHTRLSKLSALSGLNAGRAAILNARGLTDEQREQALAGIEKARDDLQREMREGQGDKGEE